VNGWQRMVGEFHARFGQPIGRKPGDLNRDRMLLRKSLMAEELCETLDAMAVGDMAEIADGLADLIYVAIGTAIEYGIDLDPVFHEVHRSNMTKTPGYRRGDGKILKGPYFEPPRIAEEIERQKNS
jgi:predicted HAD superfamily Cof-like phosphohydrolase